MNNSDHNKEAVGNSSKAVIKSKKTGIICLCILIVLAAGTIIAVFIRGGTKSLGKPVKTGSFFSEQCFRLDNVKQSSPEIRASDSDTDEDGTDGEVIDIRNEFRHIYADYFGTSQVLQADTYAMYFDVLGDSVPEIILLEPSGDDEMDLYLYAIDSSGKVCNAYLGRIDNQRCEVSYIKGTNETVWSFENRDQGYNISYEIITTLCTRVSQTPEGMEAERCFSGEIQCSNPPLYTVKEDCTAYEEGGAGVKIEWDYKELLNKYFEESKALPFSYSNAVQGKEAILQIIQN